jgi:cytochrome c-type biogenesis protein CcmH/NrfG
MTNDEVATSNYNIATFCFISLRAEDSIEYANKMLDLQPYHIGALSLRANAEDFLGRDEQAIADWARLLSINSKDAYAYKE